MPAMSLPRILPRIQDPALEFRKYLNLLLALSARRRNDERVCTRPFEVTIDLTTGCQLSCPYCSVGNGTMKRTHGLLKQDLHRRMMQELAGDLFVCWYFSTGEPLLNKHLGDIVAETRGKEIFSCISTNLSLPLTDARIDELLTCGLGCISVSLDGASSETYVQYRRGGQFDLVVGNMRRLVARKRELGLRLPHIEWRFLVFEHNHHEIPRARQLAREWGVDLLEFYPGLAPIDPPVGEVRAVPANLPLDLAHEGPAWQAGLARRDTRLARAIADTTRACYPPAERMGRKCDWLYFGSMLYPSGSIGPCCVASDEPDDFGRLDEDSDFTEIWNNTRFRDARSRFGSVGGDRGQDLVCARCPLPAAQDYQFMTTLRGLLLNAPDWVLKALSRAPERFFHEVDFDLMPTELEPLRQGSLRIDDPFRQATSWLDDRIAAAPGDADLIWIREAIADSSSAASPQPPARSARTATWLSRLAHWPSPAPPLSESVPPALANLLAQFVWKTNPMPAHLPDPCLLQLGCGDRALPGFVNIDFLPDRPDILDWDLLDAWPDRLANAVDHGFAEDVLEHFFFEEQVYLLAQMNRVLKTGGVFRVLMPNLGSLVAVRQQFDASQDFLARNFGVQTGADALNLGMRFGGHRWLHDDQSLIRLAELAGFAATPTSCRVSKVPQLTGINRGDESTTLTFAHDLVKTRSLRKLVLSPLDVSGARPCGELSPKQPLYKSTGHDSQVRYVLPETISARDIVLLVFRGGNLSQTREHNHSVAYLIESEEASLPIDRSLSSAAHSSMVAAPLIRARVGDAMVSSIRLDPSRNPADFFTVGPAEVYLLG